MNTRILTLALGVLLGALAQLSASGQEYWISSSSSGTHAGTLANPFDGSTATKFDTAMASLPANSTMHILGGTYQTYGGAISGAGYLLESGQHILGAGMDITVLQLIQTADQCSGMQSDGVCTNIVIEDLTIDFSGSSGHAKQGIYLFGAGFTVSRVKLVNMTGAADSSWELFPIAMFNDWGPSLHLYVPDPTPSIVSECEIVMPVPHGASAIAISGVTNAPFSGVVRNNRIIFNDSSTARAVDVPSFGINICDSDGMLVIGNYVTNAACAVYSDSGGNKNFTVSGNQFANIVLGLSISDFRQENIVFENNNVLLTHAASPGPSGIWFWWKTNSDFRNVVIRHNRFTRDTNSIIWALDFEKGTGMSFINNSHDPGLSVNVGWPPYGIYATGTNVYGNTDLNGNYIISYSQTRPPVVRHRVSVSSSSYTALLSDKYIGIKTTANVALTLPSASGLAGKEIIVAKEVGAGNSVTLYCSSYVDGQTSGSLSFNGAFQGRTFVSDGSNWYSH